MAKLIYSALASPDGYIEDPDGNFGWARPDEEVHRFINELERPIGTHLYSRRLYETMVYWEAALDGDDQPSPEREYAEIWQAADKVVYSSTLQTPSSARTRIERDFDAEAVRVMKAEAQRDITVGGAALGARAIATGLVDELQLLLASIIIGGGKRALPDDVRVRLELLDEQRFTGGVVFLRYATRP